VPIVAWRLEAIEWEDVTTISRFTLEHDFDSERLFKLSVGFVVHETSEYVVLADDVDISGRPDSPNNYGTIIPKGCIRSRQVVHGEVTSEPRRCDKAASDARSAVKRFLQHNPHIVATAHDIGVRVGVEQCEVQRQLAELESRGEALQALPGLWRAGKQGARRDRPGT
jgi:hypothetical protein